LEKNFRLEGAARGLGPLRFEASRPDV